jgi:hypothetical protein
MQTKVLSNEEINHEYQVYRVKEFCARTINTLNYSKVIDLNLSKSDYKYIRDEVEVLFNSSLIYISFVIVFYKSI